MGWKRRPCFSLLRLWMNHVPTTAIRFSNRRGCWCSAQRTNSDVLGSEGKGGGEGKDQCSRSGLALAFPLLSLGVFSWNQSQALLPWSERPTLNRNPKLLLFLSFFFPPIKERLIFFVFIVVLFCFI